MGQTGLGVVALSHHATLSGRGLGPLITDWKDNIADLFEPGKEVVCYKSVDECLERIDYYSRHEAERAAIAAAGQRRTLQHHSYAQVVADQVRIFESYLARKHAGERTGEET